MLSSQSIRDLLLIFMSATKTFHLVIAFCCFCTLTITTFSQDDEQQFIYNGFQGAKLLLDGGAIIQPRGLLQLTNTSKQLAAHAFHPTPIKFNKTSLSFSTTFVFAMYPEISVSGYGIVFFMSPTKDLSYGLPGKYFGLFNSTTNGNSSNHIFAVELDAVRDLEFQDIDNNHVGIDVNNLHSVSSAPAGYFSDADGQEQNLTLISAKPMQVWVEFDHKTMVVEVTMAPLGITKPKKPLLSTKVNLTDVILESMYLGFSATTGTVASSHYVVGWSFSHGGEKAQELKLSKLPQLPRVETNRRKLSVGVVIMVVIISAVLIILGVVFYLRRRKKYEEVLEDWEQEYILQRFSYKDLYTSTRWFKEGELLGAGGFGKVYKGILPSTKAEVAVKKISHGSGQGMREFVAEIACMGRLRHRNLVPLLGYCRRKGELLLVYDYMPNGSLDKFLYNGGKPNLSWSERYKIIRGVASALLYLHEEWEKVVVHRDVKASNVLLDADMSARLGDFGLARLYDHGTNPQTTHVVGTIGYLAPELTTRGKATTSTDVFSFGIFILEVACGKSPISSAQDSDDEEEKYLVDWVYDHWKQGEIVEASDPRLEGFYVIDEMKLVLKLGLLCCNPQPEARPSMRQVMQFLDGDSSLSEKIPEDAETSHFSSANQTSSNSIYLSTAGASVYSSHSTTE